MAFSMGLATRVLDLGITFGVEDARPHHVINSHKEHKGRKTRIGQDRAMPKDPKPMSLARPESPAIQAEARQ